MIRRLFNLGVKPEALLLPKRPDQGKCKMCSLDSLQALLDSLLVRTKNDLSRHKEVRRHCQLHALPTEALRSPVCSDSLDCLHQLQGFWVQHACSGSCSALQVAGLTLSCAQVASSEITSYTVPCICSA